MLDGARIASQHRLVSAHLTIVDGSRPRKWQIKPALVLAEEKDGSALSTGLSGTPPPASVRLVEQKVALYMERYYIQSYQYSPRFRNNSVKSRVEPCRADLVAPFK
ncbi:hypothetical protein RRG08_063947 [Elysia crispata]|uniref:Uncharacterized protein n=1 Tax=Elysia crispata TaxID=231223 RepID=A0AAE1CX86_9GAST|nr:hypothetical protein RRG08_063947 [Elysia crispata]